MNNTNKILLILLAISMCVMIFLITININIKKDLLESKSQVPNANFLNISNSNLIYDTTTNIVYVKIGPDGASYTAYISDNGNPYKYNPETLKLEKIQ